MVALQLKCTIVEQWAVICFYGQYMLKGLKLVMHNKQRDLLSKGVLLLHGNMYLHSAATSVEEIS
jgi:hypothetical protein